MTKSKKKDGGMPATIYVGAEQAEYRRFNATREADQALPAHERGLVAEYTLKRMVRVSRTTDVQPVKE